MTPPPANDNQPSPDAVQLAAEGFLKTRGLGARVGFGRLSLLASCARYLRRRFGLGIADARQVANRAAGVELERLAGCFLEFSGSPDTAVLVDPVAGTREVITNVKARLMLAARHPSPGALGLAN